MRSVIVNLIVNRERQRPMIIDRDPEGVEPQNIHAFADLENAHVLEIGCGDGRLTWRYAAAAHRVTAIDPNPDRLDTALAARPDSLRDSVTFSRAHAEALPFAAETFNAVILAWSL